jgi:16S rRNA (cytidine1402-2'-O)-methyltransferase
VATLYIIGTPIGNLGDITFRAVETLKSVNLIACEDTRHTLKLLNHLEVKATLISVRSQNEKFSAEKVIRALDDGENVAYTSDAGTPGISDPGSILAKLAAEAGHNIVPIPGPSAFASLVSVAGGMDKTVIFEGFLSPKPGRRRSRLKELLAFETAFVIYESPFRIVKLMEELADLDKERYVCIGREMTKLYEEYIRGSAAEVLSELVNRDKQLGEFSVFVSGKSDKKKLNI